MRKLALSIIITAWFLICTNARAQQNVAPELIAYPDMILYDGKVLTADDKFTVVEAVAIRGGEFLKIGKNDAILALADAADAARGIPRPKAGLPTSTKPIDQTGLPHDQIEKIKQCIGANPPD